MTYWDALTPWLLVGGLLLLLAAGAAWLADRWARDPMNAPLGEMLEEGARLVERYEPADDPDGNVYVECEACSGRRWQCKTGDRLKVILQHVGLHGLEHAPHIWLPPTGNAAMGYWPDRVPRHW